MLFQTVEANEKKGEVESKLQLSMVIKYAIVKVEKEKCFAN